jgi:histone-lysine N-methyltransferase SETD2
MSPHDYADRQSESVADAVTAMKLETDRATDVPTLNGRGTLSKDDTNGMSRSPSTIEQNNDAAVKSRSSSRTPVKKEEEMDHLANMGEKVKGDITVKQEPGQPPKLTRSSSQKVVARPPQLVSHLLDSTAEAKSTFDLMDTCTYANKYMGYTEHAMECDCAEEWGKLRPLLSSLLLFLFCSTPFLCSARHHISDRSSKVLRLPIFPTLLIPFPTSHIAVLN